MLRYQKHSYLAQNWQLSKLSIYKLNDVVSINKIDIQAGHFKLNNANVEHGLLVSNIAGQTPKAEMLIHGKRQRRTLLIKTTASSSWKWAIFDKFIHVILPMIGDLHTPKQRKSDLVNFTYSWRIRNFFEWADADVLLSDRILKKDIYLPLFFNITLSSNISHQQNEHILRMFRTPVILYNKSRPLAGDDLLV